MSDHYYYKCGTHTKTNVVTCIKSSNDYKDFNEPEDYHTIVRLSLRKSFADKKMPTTYGLAFGVMGALYTYSNLQTGETQVLTEELKTPYYAIINK